MKKAFILSALSVVFLLAGSCRVAKESKSSKTANVLMVPPGLLQFEAEALSYKATGGFHRWQFTKLNFPKNQNESLEGLTATVEVDISSVYERTIRLTNDLKSPKYLDAESHPRAFIQIFEVKKIEGDKYVCKMTMSLKGFSKTFYSEFDVVNKEPFHVRGSADVMRSDYKIEEGECPIPNDIHIIYDTDLSLTEPETISKK